MRRRTMRRLGKTLAPPRPPVARVVTGCTIETVTPGAARGGATAVWVWVDDDLIGPVPYIGSPPAQGSQVAVQLQDGSPLILGKPTGFPDI